MRRRWRRWWKCCCTAERSLERAAQFAAPVAGCERNADESPDAFTRANVHGAQCADCAADVCRALQWSEYATHTIREYGLGTVRGRLLSDEGLHDSSPGRFQRHLTSLAGASAATVTAQANSAINFATTYQRRFGITGFRISLNYPTLVSNPANLPNATFTTANYATYVSYYQQVIQGLRAAGLGVDIETNILFPQYVGPQYNFNGLTVATLEAGQAENAQHVIDLLKPDHVNLAAEPSTIAFLTGFSSINDPVGYPAYVNAIRSQITNTNPGGTKIGAGGDNWQSSSFISNLIAMTSLDYYDLHMYPPDHLQDGIADLAQFKASGKPLIMTESWLDKEEAAVDGTMGPIDSQVVFVRNGYSFWGNIDAQYVTSLIQLARCNNVQEVDLSYALMLFTYVDFSPTTSGYAYAQMLPALNAGLQAAESSGTVTLAGRVVQQYTGVTPSSVRLRF